MDAWESGRFDTLCAAVEDQWRRGDGMRRQGALIEADWLETAGNKFQSLVHDGKLSAAVRSVTNRANGGLYRPDDKCSKETTRLVIDILREKHPEGKIPPALHFEDMGEIDPDIGIFCYEEDVLTQSTHLTGAAGPDGVDAETFKGWLTRHGVHSEALRAEMGKWVEILGKTSPEYAMYRAANTARMLAADKKPGVRPLACGVIYMRLWGRCCLAAETRDLARDTCGNLQTCAGLQAGIEGNIHAMRAVFPASNGWTTDNGIGGGSQVDIGTMLPGAERLAAAGALGHVPADNLGREEEAESTTDESADPSESGITEDSRYVDNTGFGTMLVDARNAFNEINRYPMLWAVHHRWTRGSRFAFNCYRH